MFSQVRAKIYCWRAERSLFLSLYKRIQKIGDQESMLDCPEKSHNYLFASDTIFFQLLNPFMKV